MNSRLTRRSFLQRSTLTAGGLLAIQFGAAPSIVRAAVESRKLNCAVIGCGGRGAQAHLPPAAAENLLAIVDPDEKRHAVVQKWLKGRNRDSEKVKAFTDYRRMFDELGKQLDVVFIAAPNHQHTPPAVMALQLGKNVYCEKPLTHDIAEARRLRTLARQTKAATQMGNQGHCTEGYRRLCEYIWEGTIGPITETHSWTDRANGGRGPRPPSITPPEGLHWDEWIGPAPYRDYHIDLHPHEWHGWYDFGNGSLGNMACHVLDGVFWALMVDHPTSIEVEEMNGGSNERYPVGTRIRWDVPARGSLPPVKVYWYDGRRGAEDPGDGNQATKGRKGSRILPPLLLEMQKQYPDDEFEASGSLYVGEKGIIYTGCYGDRMHILPAEKMRQTPVPPQVLSRPDNIMVNFLDACRVGSTKTEASFEYGARLTEFTHLGNLAEHAGPGKKVEWDGPNMRVTNLPELNAWVKREYREGWRI